ncbi:MAG TPA: DcrB-related protein [Chthonomonadaceae bacterium]|nr:DcrB-related protein [Chthonomonadaceae bacterium]
MPFRLLRQAAAIGFMALLLWAATALAAPGANRYVNTEDHYSFAPPAGWKQNTRALPKPFVLFVGPIEQQFAVNLNIYSEPIGNMSLDQYVALSKQKAAQSKIVTISAVRPAKLDGVPAYRLSGTLQMGARKVANRQVVCVRNKRGYVLTLSASPATIKKYDPVFDKIIASFTWEK